LAESTLTLAYSDIATAITRLFGFKAYASWDAQEIADAAAMIKDGLVQLYYPPPCPPDSKAHSWRFLRPTLSLVVWSDVAVSASVTVTGVYSAPNTTITATAASFYPSMVGRSLVVTGVGTFTVVSYTSSTVIVVSGNATASGATFSIASDGLFALPDGCSGIEGDLLFSADTGMPIPLINERQLAEKRQTTSVPTGRPSYAALRPRTFDATVGQRWDIWLYPTPDSAYTLSYASWIHPDTITSTLVYVMGGTPHSRTAKESILLAGERLLNKQITREAPFFSALRASIDFDRRRFASATVGQFGDNSDGMMPARRRHGDDAYVRYNSNLYTG
jgi:hypothetical protein